MIDARLSVNVVILPSLYFQMFHHAMYMNNDHNLCISFMHMYKPLPMQPSRRHFVKEMTIQLHLSIFSRQFGYSA